MIVEVEQEDIARYPANCPNMELTEDFKRHIFTLDDVFLFDMKLHYSGGGATNFNAILIHLIGKADQSNMRRLSYGYPSEVLAMWLCRNDMKYYDKIIKEL